MKSINTVVQDVYDLMESKDYSGDLNSIAMQAGREVEEALKQAFTPREDKRGLRMSALGRCERAQWYNYHGYKPEEIKGEVYLTFLARSHTRSGAVALLKLSGHTVEDQQKKAHFEGVNGSQDCTN